MIMTVVVVTPPEPVVTFDEAVKHVRIDDDDERGYVEGLIAAATAWIDGPAGWLGRSIGRQTLEYRGDYWPTHLPFIPLVEVVSAEVGGVPVSNVTVRADGRLSQPEGLSHGEVVIQYTAGYEKAPSPIKVAIMMLVTQWYTIRANVVAGSVSEVPFAVDALLQPYRVYR